MASLTEAAKAVLEGKTLEEGIYPEVSPGKISNPNPVDPSTTSTSNAKTLRPGSAMMEPDPKHNEAEDLGGSTPTSLYSDNIGAKASGKNKRDKSVKGAGSNAEPTKKLAAEEMEQDGEVVEERYTIAERLKALKEARKACAMEEEEIHEDEEIEMSEELEDFIAEAIEAGLSEEEILDAIDENFDFISEEDEDYLEEDEQMDEAKLNKMAFAYTRDWDEKKKAWRQRSADPKSDSNSTKTKKKNTEKRDMKEDLDEALDAYEVDMSEHVDALLAGENLSEDFHEKATTIFESAVKAKLAEEVELLEQAYAETLEERVNEIMEELALNVDEYLNYVVEQWIEENEVAVESALRSELTEDFISGLRSLFAEHYIDIPEEEVPVVEELSATVEELEDALNEEIQRNVALTSMLSESRKTELTAYVCEGLTSTQASKLRALTEGVEYTSDEEFIEKVSTLRENYFPVAVKSDEVLDRVDAQDPQSLTESLDGPMAKYVNAIGRSLPN